MIQRPAVEIALLLTPTTVVGVKRLAASVGLWFCLSVCLSVCPHDNSKTNDPTVFKLGIGNDLGIAYKFCDFGVKMSKEGYKVQKGDRVTGVYAVYRVSSVQPL